METKERTWKLVDLAEAVGASPRTIRYYVQRGLLPAPVFRGKDTAYSEEHLLRLLAIRRLQDQHIPLENIQNELERRSLDQLRALAMGQEVLTPEGGPSEGTGSTPGGERRGGRDGGLERRGFYYAGSGTPWGPPAVVQWDHIELLPGLELLVSEDADAFARSLADELKAYVAGRIGFRGAR